MQDCKRSLLHLTHKAIKLCSFCIQTCSKTKNETLVLLQPSNLVSFLKSFKRSTSPEKDEKKIFSIQNGTKLCQFPCLPSMPEGRKLRLRQYSEDASSGGGEGWHLGDLQVARWRASARKRRPSPANATRELFARVGGALGRRRSHPSACGEIFFTFFFSL
jgi:hypothetical protein